MINILFSPAEIIIPIVAMAVPATIPGLTYLGVMIDDKINKQYYSFSRALQTLYDARFSPKLKKMIRKEGIRKENGELADLPEIFTYEDYYSGKIMISEFESAIDYYVSKGLIQLNSSVRKTKLEKNIKNLQSEENHNVLTISFIAKNNKKIAELQEKIDNKKSLLELINEEYDKLNAKMNINNSSNTSLVEERVSLEILKESIGDVKDILDKKIICIDDLIKLVQEKQKLESNNEKMEQDIYDNSFDEESKEETLDSLEKDDTDNIDIIEKEIDSILTNYNTNKKSKTNNSENEAILKELFDMRKKVSIKQKRISILNNKIEKAVGINIFQSYKNTNNKKIDNLKEKYNYDEKMIRGEDVILDEELKQVETPVSKRMH